MSHRRPYCDRNHQRPYSIRDFELGTPAGIGTLPSVTLNDLSRYRYGSDEARPHRHLENLDRRGLIRRRITNPDRAVYLASTSQAHCFVESHRLSGLNAQWVLYHRFVKPREAGHDTALYRLYQQDVERMQAQGGRLERVILRFELKTINRELSQIASWPESAQIHHKQETAHELGLTVRLLVLDLQLEYETSDRELARANLNLATGSLSPGRMGDQSACRFRQVCTLRRLNLTSPSSAGYGALVEEILSL
ncbi:MAG TPA: hypothetical protein VG206_18800 [Terriglobia bacterium]|nr:hypothetical protein [Terriglobia bacterium]